MNKYLFSAKTFFVLAIALLCSMQTMAQKKYTEKDLAALKQTLMQTVAGKSKEVQVMVDQIFSFAELGFQEVETSKYITSVLTKNGFTVENGISNIPTAWMAKWGSGSPVIALGSDVDCIPKASQKPGVAYKAPIVEGAPGHGEGHNSGQAVII
jgi:aminobenzoyl-glutamate utilization protein B